MEVITRQVVRMEHLTRHNNLFGGQLLAWLDEAGYMFIVGKTQYSNIVTVSLNDMSFKEPVNLGDILTFEGKIIKTGDSSIQIEITAIINAGSANSKTATQVNITYVMLDANGKPYPLFKEKPLNY